MTSNLTAEQRALGRQNANTAIGVTRRDFLKATAVTAPGIAYFGYKTLGDDRPVRAAIIGTGNEGCQAMIRDHNRDYLDYIRVCDARPSQLERAKKEFGTHKQYTAADLKAMKWSHEIKDVMGDPDVELVVIALPLWLHAPIAIEAMKAGKHVFCEKLMAHNVSQCKEMCKTAREANRLLAIGHQRHYSVLYDNANELVKAGMLGDIRHIRALWHRNNGQPQIAKNRDGTLQYDDQGNPVYVRDDAGHIVYFDGWKPPIPPEDKGINFDKYGYKSLDEMIRWRLYNRTGAGLMAELGSHQLDACSIFLGKKHPLAVTGIGGTFFYQDGREVDDHVFVNFEFPVNLDDDHKPVGNERVIVTYSSINTNGFEKYGEELMGTKGTMIVEEERDLYLFNETDRNRPSAGVGPLTSYTIEKSGGGKAALETSPSAAGPTAAASLGGLATANISRGYREELEHFAYCIRKGNASDFHAPAKLSREDLEKNAGARALLPRCRGEVALADAVIALTSNLAMRQKRRIDFDPRWFDPTAPEVPEGAPGPLAQQG